MSLTVYISGASSEWQRAASVAAILESSGSVTVPCKWWRGAAEWAGKDHERGSNERIRLTRELFQAIEEADTFVFLAPSDGHSSRMAWAELGYALNLNADRWFDVIVAGNYWQSICTSLADRVYQTDAEAIAWVLDAAKEKLP